MTAYGHDEGPALAKAMRRLIGGEPRQMPLLPEVVQAEQRLEREAKAEFRLEHMERALALLGAAWGPLRVSPALLDQVTDLAFYGEHIDPGDYMGELLIREVCGQDDVIWTIEEAHDVLEVALG
jgi:hypothetical protein